MTTRGDTTTYICQFADDFDMTTITSAVLAVRVYGMKSAVKYSDCEIDIANKQIRRTFSQEESLALIGTVSMELIIMQGETRTSVSMINVTLNPTLVKEVIV